MSVNKIEEREYEENHFIDDDEEEGNQGNKYLTFKIAQEVYGIDISEIIEIIELQKITEVPDMPEYVKGVINLRGKVIPIIDLRLRFNMEKREYDDRTCIVIVKVDEKTIGFIVDTVFEVVDVNSTEIDPPPQFKKSLRDDRYISGIGKAGENIIILLDADKIIHLDELNEISKKM